MSILEDGVLSSKSYHGRGMFRFDRISNMHKKLIKEITQRQRRKFIRQSRDKKVIPWRLLYVLWDLGYLPGENRPDEGMRIPVLLNFLREEEYRDERNRTRGILLHDIIDQEEYPSQNMTRETFVKCGRGKFMPVSFLRKEPGTIFK
jgi:hypothetical protein